MLCVGVRCVCRCLQQRVDQVLRGQQVDEACARLARQGCVTLQDVFAEFASEAGCERVLDEAGVEDAGVRRRIKRMVADLRVHMQRVVQ